MTITNKMLQELEGSLLINADSFTELAKMDKNIIDSCLLDPPYGIGFLGKEWDNFSPDAIEKKTKGHKKIDHKKQSARSASMHAGLYDISLEGSRGYQDWCFNWAVEALRVLKPGAHLLSFCSTRMYRRLTVALEEAGFEIRDTISWNFGSGFPKSEDVALKIDKNFGHSARGHAIATASKYRPDGKELPHAEGLPKYKAKTKEAKPWEDFGTGLKPAMELICLARKPLGESSVAKNVLRWGTGALNINAGRIGTEKRFPANTIFDKEAGEILDVQNNSLPSRFFYCPKPNNKEKNAGLNEMPILRRDVANSNSTTKMSKKMPQPQRNPHPTIKPVNLLQYLCRLITPPNGVVLDFFMGSGSCGIAARSENFRYIGIELEEKYFEVAYKRIKHFANKNKAA